MGAKYFECSKFLEHFSPSVRLKIFKIAEHAECSQSVSVVIAQCASEVLGKLVKQSHGRMGRVV